jgi:1-acyl-sn-glycerol-3-phosphate acyltransferase
VTPPASRKAASAKKTTAKKATTSTARKVTAKKATSEKPAAKKATTEKATAKKATTTAAAATAPEASRPASQARPPRRAGSFASGAARATGERRRRTGTPLIEGSTVDASAPRRRAADATPPIPDVETHVLPPVAQTERPVETAPERMPVGPTGADVPRRDPDPTSDTAPDATLDTGGSAADPVAPDDAPTPTAADISRRARRLRAVPTGDAVPDAPVRRPRPRPTRDPRPRPARPPRPATASGAGPTTTGAAAASPTAATGHVGGVAGSPASDGGSLVASVQARAGRLLGSVLEGTDLVSEARPGPAELVQLAVDVLRSAATAAGLPADEAERQVAESLAYLRGRLTGDYTVDEFGFDEDYTVNVHLPLLRPLYRSWFRVEVRGIENVPAHGGALLVGNHSGTVALDSLMTQVAVFDEHPGHRHLRMLGADLIFRLPFLGTMARRSGTTLAANTDAERLLSGGQLVGVWPEGFKGTGKPFTERYKLQRFGRGGFVSAALRSGVPIVPVSIVGAEEIYPILGDLPAVARLLGVPYAPVTPTWPLLGPLGLVPLPSKWLIEFGPPIETTSFGPEAADDPMLVFDLTDQVRETIQQTLYSLLMQRTSVFF